MCPVQEEKKAKGYRKDAGGEIKRKTDVVEEKPKLKHSIHPANKRIKDLLGELFGDRVYLEDILKTAGEYRLLPFFVML